MKIFGKMLVSFGVVIMLFLALSIYNISQSSILKRNGDSLNQDGVEPAVELTEIARLTENTRVQMVSAYAFKNIENTETALANLEEIQKKVKDLDKKLEKNNSTTVDEAMHHFEEKWGLFDERVRKNEKLMRDGDWSQAAEGLKAGGTLFNDAMSAFSDLQSTQKKEINKIVKHNEEVYSKIFFVSIVLMVLTTVITLGISSNISRQIVQRIKLVGERAKAIADGDLSMDLIKVKGKDEIKELADSLNHMQSELIEIVSNAHDSSQLVSASAEQLSATSQESSATAETITVSSQSNFASANAQREKLEQVTTSLSNLDANLQSIAQNGVKMDELSQTTFEKTHVGVQVLHAINEQIESISNSSKETEASVKKLNDKSNEIGNIISMITQISEQTNLLALNAAIEAARAGEAGKGFAVVADEVRKLAEQAGNSADQIFNMINEIQVDIQSVIESIHVQSENVENGLSKSQEVQVVFNEIESMVGEVSQNAQDLNESIKSITSISQSILNNTHEVYNLADETLKDAESINRASETQLASIEEITAASESLATLAEQLQKVIFKFNIGNK